MVHLLNPLSENRRTMDPRRTFLLALVIVSLAAQLSAEQAKRADDFVESMGINIHVSRNYGGWATSNPYCTHYTDWVKPRMNELGIRYARDGFEWLSDAGVYASEVNVFKDFYSATGIKVLMILGGDGTTIANQIQACKEIGPALFQIEGPNEPWNNFGRPAPWFQYAGLQGSPAAKVYMQDLWSSLKNDAALKNIPVVGPSFYYSEGSGIGDVSAWCNYGNDHPYLNGADIVGDWWEPGLNHGTFDGYSMDQRLMYPSPMQFQFTETGKQADATGGASDGSPSSQAKKILICYLEGLRLGVARVFIYDLVEGSGLSLIDANGTPRPSFYAVKNMISLFSEKGQNTFATHDYGITITGAPSSVHHVVLEKSNGTWYVVLWNDVKTWNMSWDVPPNTEKNNPPVSVTVNFGRTVPTVKTYQPLTGASALNTYSNIASQSFDVPDHPLIIECSAGALPARTAYNGPHKIPGRTEAEDYDNGGEGVAYHDSDAVNNGGQYRNGGVDVNTTGDPQGGGYVVGWTDVGEWLEYTIDSVKADKYDINMRCGSGMDGAQVRVKLDGATLGTITVPNLGNWSDKQTVTIAGVTLTAGTNKILRLEITGSGADINWIEFAKATATGAGLAGRHVMAGKPEMVEILSLDGRVVARRSLNDRDRMDLGSVGLSAGIYFIRRNGQTVSDRQMIIVNK